MPERKITFKAKVNDPLNDPAKFYEGRIVLNRTAWRGKEPRTCAISNYKISYVAGAPAPYDCIVEVLYRPHGFLSYIGDTKFDGWRRVEVKRGPDGTYLDADGNRLPDGQLPVEVPVDFFPDREFNDLDLGESLGEADVEGIRRATAAEVFAEIEAQSRVVGTRIGGADDFACARKRRPDKQIIITGMPTGPGRMGGGDLIVNLNGNEPRLEELIEEHLTQLMCEFMEGQINIKNMSIRQSGYKLIFVELNSALMDCRPNEVGEPTDFNVLNTYVKLDFMDNLAKMLMQKYRADVTVVTDPKIPGFLVRPL